MEERTIRVWVDDPNAVFRLGLTACLEQPAFQLAGESSSFSPEPDLARTDVLVFGLAEPDLGRALESARDRPVHLVAVASSGDDTLLVDAVDAGVAGVLVRNEISPRGFQHCLRSVVGGSCSLPTSVLPHLAGAPSSRRGRLIGELTNRELDVLRLLSKGENTREIAENLCYSEKTVKNIVHDVLVRMNCRNRAQAVALATRRGLI